MLRRLTVHYDVGACVGLRFPERCFLEDREMMGTDAGGGASNKGKIENGPGRRRREDRYGA